MPAFEPNVHPNGIPNTKSGNVWTASMHIFCAIVGAGVLALPNTFVSLGWVAGPILIIVFYAISMLTSFLLIDVYQVDGIEFPRYHLAVKYILNKWNAYGLAIIQVLDLVLITLAYTVSPATAMKRIAQLACEYEGKDLDDCWDQTWKMTLIFGAVQVPLSLMPNLESLWWISGIGALMSVIYSTIALALGLKYASNHLGTVGGNSTTPANKAFGILNSLGAIAFAYSYHVILLEIQDTIRQPPLASKTMKKSTFWSIDLVFFYYFVIAVGGYASLGNEAPSYIFSGYPQAPRWVMMFGNICLLIHMLSSFQLYAQPVFDTMESNIKHYLFKGKYAKHARTAGIEGGLETPSMDAKAVEDAPGADEKSAISDDGKPAVATAEYHAADAAPALSRKSSGVALQLERLSRASAMYRASTALARDDVEDNEEHRLPLYQRFIFRTIYVIAITVIACCLPFFSDIAGLIGAIAFWPLSVYFPIHMWRKVYKPVGWFNWLLHAIDVSMFLVAIGATIGSIRSIIQSSQDYTIFGD